MSSEMWFRIAFGVTFVALVSTATAAAGLSGLILVSIIPARRIPTEEAQLRERFGDSWTEYASATRIFFPGR